LEYQAASVLGGVLRELNGNGDELPAHYPYGLVYTDHVANVVAFTINGVAFHAAITAV
jgi:hypothetical protein